MKTAAILLIKNEIDRIHVTIDSINPVFDACIVFDTGSTDGTVEWLKENVKIPFHLKEGKFIDFATSNNELLDFADTCKCSDGSAYDYYVKLDGNDEFKGSLPSSEDLSDGKYNAYFVERHLRSAGNKLSVFSDSRLIKANTGDRYVGVVHEYLKVDGPIGNCNTFHIYQDREADDNKSAPRWKRDVVLLEKEHERDPTNTRTVFYLAQSYGCVGDRERCLEFYIKRSQMGGYRDEVYHSLLTCGRKCQELSRPWPEAMEWYLKAYKHSNHRIESLIPIAQHYGDSQEYTLAYIFIKLACDIAYPSSVKLFVDRDAYDYRRWHLLGIYAYYYALHFGKDKSVLKIGEDACTKAIEQGVNKTLDERNLACYLKL